MIFFSQNMNFFSDFLLEKKIFSWQVCEILLTRLSTSFGIRGALLEWFRSYLADRKFTIKLNSVTGKHSQTRGALGLSPWSGFVHYVHIFS